MSFSDRWKPQPRGDPRQALGSRAAGHAPHGMAGSDAGFKRHSNGLQQFFDYIRGEQGLNLLDLSGASQANIGFITDLGHRLYSEDLLQTLEQTFGGPGDFYENQQLPDRQKAYLQQNLAFPDQHFDGALVWDALEYLSPPLLKETVDRLTAVVKPRSYILALFHADERADTIPTYSYRIADAGTLLLAPRGLRRPGQFFNNRAVEKLFQSCESVKFFLTRDALREVIVKR